MFCDFYVVIFLWNGWNFFGLSLAAVFESRTFLGVSQGYSIKWFHILGCALYSWLFTLFLVVHFILDCALNSWLCTSFLDVHFILGCTPVHVLLIFKQGSPGCKQMPLRSLKSERKKIIKMNTSFRCATKNQEPSY